MSGPVARLLGATLLAMAPTLASADRSFILPSSTMVSGTGNTITVDAAGSDHLFFFDHRPLALETIRISRPDGAPAEPSNPTRTRLRSVFDLRVDQEGTWKVASQQSMVGGTFRLNGEERRVGGRGGPPPGNQPVAGGGDRDRVPVGAERGPPGGGDGGPRRQPPVLLKDLPAEATDLHLTETLNTTETFVTAGAPTVQVLKPTGHGLECEPITHPNSLATGEMARFRFLVDGRPAPGIKVAVIAGGERYRETTEGMDLVTDRDGTVAVRWPAAGLYWLGAETEDKHPAEARAETRRMIYSATLEVMTP